MNSKSKLNELCQKQNISIKYETKRIGGLDHKPIFESIVFLNTQKFTATGNSKSIAEENLAEKILNNFLKIDHNQKQKIIFDEKIVVFVDLENVPNIGNIGEKFRVIGFASTYSSIYNMASKYISTGIDVRFTNSPIKNGADVFMIYFIMRHFDEFKDYEIVILSRDKFSVAFKDILSEFEKINVRLITKVDDLF